MKRFGIVLGLAWVLAGCGSGSGPADGGGGSDGGDGGGVDAGQGAEGGADVQTHSGAIVDSVYRYCVLSDACAQTSSQGYVSLCVVFGEYIEDLYLTNFPGPYADQLRQAIECGAAATSCAQLAHCAGGDAYDTSYCTMHPAQSCDGTKVVSCRSTIAGLPTVEDCAAYGQQCHESNGQAFCTTGNTCTATSDAGTGSDGTCNGTRYVQCQDGFERVTDCATLAPGATCQVPGTGGSLTGACVPPNAATCTDPDLSRCDSDLYVNCTNGHEYKYDCTLLEAQCGPRPDAGADAGSASPYTCLPNATECTDTMPPTCVGTHLQMCIYGRIRDVDCAQLGFTTCGARTTDGGTSPTTCVP